MKFRITLLILLAQTIMVTAQVPAYVPSSGLQAWWPFSGNANDHSGNNYHGTVTGALLSADRFNNPNSAYSFNGSSDFIYTSFAGVLGAGSRAVSFWAKTPGKNGLSEYAVAWGENGFGDRFGCGLDYPANGVFAGGANCLACYPASNTCNNNWHHFVFQFSGQSPNNTIASVEIYQDGVKLTSMIIGPPSYQENTILNTVNSGSTNLCIGRTPYAIAPEFFLGSIDDVGVWDRMLTQCEISNLYNAALPQLLVSANPPQICRNEFSLLSASGANIYTWSNSTPGATTSVSPNITTTYSVTGTTTAGCVLGKTVSVIVFECTAITSNETTGTKNVTVYPNPVKERVIISLPFEKNATAEIYDLTGKLVYTGNFESGMHEINTTSWKKGIYIVKINSRAEPIITRIMKE